MPAQVHAPFPTVEEISSIVSQKKINLLKQTLCIGEQYGDYAVVLFDPEAESWWLSPKAQEMFAFSCELVEHKLFCQFFDSAFSNDNTSPIELQLQLQTNCKFVSSPKSTSIQLHWHFHLSEGVWCGFVQRKHEKQTLKNSLQHDLSIYESALDTAEIGVWSCAVTSIGEHSELYWVVDSRCQSILELPDRTTDSVNNWFKSLDHDLKEKARETLKSSIYSGKRTELNLSFKTKRGAIKYLKWIGESNANDSSDKAKVHGIVRDETYQKLTTYELERLNKSLESKISERTKQLEKAIKEANSANSAKSNFLAMMSHELRTPMNAIIGSLDLIDDKQLSAEQRELMQTTCSAAGGMVNILNDILDFSKVEAGKLELEMLPFSLREVVGNVVDVFIPSAERNHIQFSVFEDCTIPDCVEGDPNRLRQILFNLISNALKFAIKDVEGHVPKVTLTVKITETQPSVSHVLFSVRDNGIGMNKDTVNSLFTPFHQAEKSTQRKFGGTGLGLSICGYLCDLMGGSLEVLSVPDEGSDFNLMIPFWLVHETEQSIKVHQQLTYAVELPGTKHDKLNEIIGYLKHNCTGVAHLNKSTMKTSDVLVFVFLQEQEEMSATYQNTLENADKPVVILYKQKPPQKLPKVSVALQLDTLTMFKLGQAVENLCLKHLSSEDGDDSELLNFDDLIAELQDSDSPENGDTQLEVQGVEKSIDILVVEDNPVNKKIIGRQLERLKYTYVTAQNGREGIQLWQSCKPLLILSDCHMPVMDGFEMAKEIRRLETEKGEAERRTPLVALTGAAMTEEQNRCREAGMDDVLLKPIKMEQLKKALSKWVNKNGK